MTQFIIKTITNDTGEVFHDVVKARENEVFTLVYAESEDEEKHLYRAIQLKNALSILSKGASNLRKAMRRKDSE